jgi:hypothetical protein
MPLFSRRVLVPDEVLATLHLQSGERVLAAATTVEGGYLVATDRQVLLPQRSTHRALPWESVERASWDRESGVLAIVEAARPDARAAEHLMRVEDPGRLVDVVREQVNRSVVLTRRLTVQGQRGIRVTGRRRPVGDDRPGLAWTVAVDPGLDLGDPNVKARVDELVAGVRSEVGE